MALVRRVPGSGEIIGPAGIEMAACLFGLLLWFPAIGLPAGPVFLQPADILTVLIYPLLLAYLPHLPSRVTIVTVLSTASAGMAALNGESVMILIYYLGFLAPFMAFIGIAFQFPQARRRFVQGFLAGATLSALLFLAQFAFGAEALDFRNNRSFGLAPQFERGFALMPEVSTFATHMIYALGMLIVFQRSGAVRRIFYCGRVFSLIILALICLLLSRSSSVILIAPIIVSVAYFKGRSLTWKGLAGVVLLTMAGIVFLHIYIAHFYVDRAGTSALRSMALRAISMLSGLSVLTSGDFFGVGIGNNHQITERALALAREYNFTIILAPEGVNSFVIARIFEEGWPALCMFCFAGFFLVRALFSKQDDPFVQALAVLALSSFLVSLLVTGYRGIYMNWFWIAAGAALAVTRSTKQHRDSPEISA